jgi:hypothetical protein
MDDGLRAWEVVSGAPAAAAPIMIRIGVGGGAGLLQIEGPRYHPASRAAKD